jgi:mRNA interferase YafQ
MMLNVTSTTAFRRDYKRIKKRGLDLQELEALTQLLAAQAILDDSWHDHPLTRTGSHFDLF